MLNALVIRFQLVVTDEPRDPAPLSSSPPATLALVTTPFVFAQDTLLTTGDFLKEAKARNTSLTIDDLQDLHERGLLLPLYRIADESIDALKIDLKPPSGGNARVWTLAAAADGRLRDPAAEDYSSGNPYTPPDSANAGTWWNGYVYSAWQLLHVRHVLDERGLIQAGWHTAADEAHMNRLRTIVKALVVLSPRFLPGVIGQASIPPGITHEQLRRYRAEADTADLLVVAGLDPAELRKEAEWLPCRR